MDTSMATVATEETSSCSDASWQESFSNSKSVHFAADCQIHLVEKFDNPALWWQSEETQDIRNECIDIVEFASENTPLSDVTHRFLEKGWKEGVHCGQPLILQMTLQRDTRGLEHHITEDYTGLVEDHLLCVLEDYESGMDSNLLAVASKRSSRSWVQLALLRAKFDEEEARKSF
eukprot:scaffold6164_cov163-Amphora_coffeaeformis.AAC.14